MASTLSYPRPFFTCRSAGARGSTREGSRPCSMAPRKAAKYESGFCLKEEGFSLRRQLFCLLRSPKEKPCKRRMHVEAGLDDAVGSSMAWGGEGVQLGSDKCYGGEEGGQDGASEERENQSWHSLSPIWEASYEEAMALGSRIMLSPPWRILLLSDGSVTRHLQLLTGINIAADCFQMLPIGMSLQGLPPGTDLVPGPRLQRQVFLRSTEGGGEALVYAASWWAEEEVGGYLRDVQQPIWANLSATRAELFRDVQRLYLGFSPELERSFGVPGPFWGRHYVFYHNERPITLIYEVFSPRLEHYLGPCSPEEISD